MFHHILYFPSEKVFLKISTFPKIILLLIWTWLRYYVPDFVFRETTFTVFGLLEATYWAVGVGKFVLNEVNCLLLEIVAKRKGCRNL
jgi:hypothetical protein